MNYLLIVQKRNFYEKELSEFTDNHYLFFKETQQTLKANGKLRKNTFQLSESFSLVSYELKHIGVDKYLQVSQKVLEHIGFDYNPRTYVISAYI